MSRHVRALAARLHLLYHTERHWARSLQKEQIPLKRDCSGDQAFAQESSNERPYLGLTFLLFLRALENSLHVWLFVAQDIANPVEKLPRYPHNCLVPGHAV